ncbi:MAG: PhoX family protein [Methylophilaceae bacterium]|nr:PhoX family protein [Methylophilaceae bacterium]
MRITLITLTIVLTSITTIASANQGPSSSATPYVTVTAAGWDVTSILTVGDAASNGYKMVGIPDGLGAYDNGDGTFTLLMNHELPADGGIVRAHGSKGAFVSQWVIDKSTLRVISGKDMVRSAKDVHTWTGNSWIQGTTSFARLCSADLPPLSAFYNGSTGKGYPGLIFMNGEESGPEGRAFAWVATGADAGKVYELPHLGKFSWENALANPYTGDKTVVIGTDDATPGQIYMYVGNKQATGNAVERAGLHSGQLYGIKVTGVTTESGAINGIFSLQAVTANQSGAALQAQSNALGVTNFARPEDGHWANATTFYFATTGATVNGISNTSKLYRLDFADATDLTLGGTITMVKDASTLVGTDGSAGRSFDNIVVGEDGKLYIQEDPGNTSYVAKTWMYDPVSGDWTQILESDRNRFISGNPGYLTQDEENSGIIEITHLLARGDGKRYFLATSQAHYDLAGEWVEGGQLYLISSPVQNPKPQ